MAGASQMTGRLVSSVEWWKKDGKWTCSLICYDGDFSQTWLEHGVHLSFKVLPGLHCIGYTTLPSLASKKQVSLEPWRAMEPCPYEAEIKKGRKCRSCFRLDTVQPCMICDGTKCLAPSPDIQIPCQKSTAYVYVASFGLKEVKVGAAHDKRIPLRWIEQGANMAKRIIIGNGLEVRRFEKAIHNGLNVLPGLRTSKKVDTLWKPQDAEAEAKALARTEEEVRKRFPEFPFYHESPHDLAEIYNLPQLNRRPIEIKVKENLQITGKILGAKGHLLLLDVSNIPYFLNLNHLVGRKIETEKTETTIVQTALDKF